MQIISHSQLSCCQAHLRTHIKPLNTYISCCTATVPLCNKERKISTLILNSFFAGVECDNYNILKAILPKSY